MALKFEPATREAVYARICIHGPGGSGKTYTALQAMKTLCGDQPFGVIDTEKGRSKKYVGVNGWQFAIVTPHSFSPESLTEQLGEAAGAGLAGIIIDGGSPYWNGVDGMQEQVDRYSVANGRNDKFGSGWKAMNPVERRMWDAILSFPGHVIMTLRVKSAYVVEEKERNGRTVATPRKVGLKPIQRDNFEYEFDLVLAADQDNVFTVDKSDILLVPQGTVVTTPGPEFFDTIREFCSEGVEATSSTTYRARALDPTVSADALLGLLTKVERAGLKHAPIVDENGEPTVLGDLIIARGKEARNREEQAARDATRVAQQQPAAVPAPVVPAAPAVAPQAQQVAPQPVPQQTARPAAAQQKPAQQKQQPAASGHKPANQQQRAGIENHIIAAKIDPAYALVIVGVLIERNVASWAEVTTADAAKVFNELVAAKRSGGLDAFLANIVETATSLAPAS